MPTGRLALLFPALVLLLVQAAVAQLPTDSPAPNNVFTPADRELRQALSRAETAINEGNYSDAISSLGKLLSEGTTEDFFVPDADNPNKRTSLKAEAERLLAGLPEKGRELYELNFGAEAKALLTQAIKQRSVSQMTDVTRKYFLTSAGQEAAILLGRLHLDQGRPLSAALMFRRVRELPSSRAKYDPELSLLLATAWSFANRPDDACKVLQEIAAGQSSIKIDGKTRPLFTTPEDSLKWLTDLVGTPAQPRTNTLEQWCMVGGDETRNASVEAGMPLADLRWQALTVGNPNDGQDVKQIVRRFGDKGTAALPSIHPLAIGDTIVMRTAETVTAVNAQTGKLVWEFPPYGEKPSSPLSANPKNAAALRMVELEQKVFDDAAYGQLSSDANAIYFIHELKPVPVQNLRRVNIVPPGRPLPNQGIPTNHNQLVSLDLKGRLRWMVGGESGEFEPKMAGAFFLGPPLLHQGEVLVLAEIQQRIRLVALSAKDGKLIWEQQLTHVDELTISIDGLRRLAGVSPSFSDGQVICPTAGGAVVAVDWARRALSWGYSYPRDLIQRVSNRGVVVFNQQTVNNDVRTWPISHAILAEGCVVVTPADSSSLHCLDLLTGKPLWDPLPRKDRLEGSLYVACVHEGEIIVVGKDGLRSVNLKKGTISDMPNAQYKGSLPSGRGVYSSPHYYLPLASSQLLKIDLKEGKIAEKLETDRPLGNLVVHDVDLISLSADALSTYYLRDPLKSRIEERLAANAKDAWALARKGEILLQEGKTDEALKLLREGQQLAPDDEGIRNTLLKLLLAAMRDDYKTHANLAGEIEKLIAQPAERIAFLRVTAPGLAQAGATKDAFEAYLALAAASRRPESNAGSRAEPFEDLDRQWRARIDRWLQTRLASLYLTATAEQQKELDAVVQERLKSATDVAERAYLLNVVRFHPAAIGEQLKVASAAIDKGQLLEAEYRLSPLANSTDPAIAGPATAELARMLTTAKRTSEALAMYERLARDFANVPCRGKDTGADLLAEAKQSALLKAEAASRGFQGTAVKSAINAEQVSRFRSYQQLKPIAMATSGGLDVRGQTLTHDQSRATIVVADGFGRTVSESLLNQDGTRSFFYGYISAANYGHMVTLSMGTEVIALDTLRGPLGSAEPGRTDDTILWRTNTIDTPANSPYVSYGMQSRLVRNPIAGSWQLYTDQNGKPMGAKVAMGPWGIAYLRARQLVCVDPRSGEAIWERSGLEIGSDLFGDDERLFVVPHGSGEAEVFDAWDGAALGKRDVEKFEQRWATCGGNVLSFQEGAQIAVRLTDAWTGKELWGKAFAPGVKGCLPTPEEVALLEPSGKLTILSLHTGKPLLETKLQPEPNLTGLIVQRSSDKYLVMPGHVSQEPPSGSTYHPAPQGINSMPTTGWVYAFDRESGKSLWPAPAYVHQQGYVFSQPPELPVLLFLRHSTPTRGSAAKTVTTSLCLDKRTGAVVLQDDFPAPIHAYDIQGTPTAGEVKLTIYSQSQRSFVLKFTDEPAPPQPPAQLGPLSSLTAGSKAGQGVNVAGSVFDALNNTFAPQPGNPNVPRPVLPPGVLPPNGLLPPGVVPPR